jgi:hypothetical protein
VKTLGVTLPVVARSTSTSLGGVAGTSRDCRDGSTPVQFAVMQMGCHVDAVRRMLQQMASTGSDSCSSARASRRSGFSVSRRCHFHPGHSAFDHRPSGQVRRLADGRRLLHGSCTASLSPRGKGASPRPARGTAPRTSCSPQSRLHRCCRRPSPAVARHRPPSPAVARRRRRSSPSSRGRAVACATMGVRACRVDGHGRARWVATRRLHITRGDS